MIISMHRGLSMAVRGTDWTVLKPILFQSIAQTLEMVVVTLLIGGLLGLVLGVVLYGTRPGNLFENRVLYRVLDVLVNIIRPIPFIIFLAAMQPITVRVVGTSIGTVARKMMNGIGRMMLTNTSSTRKSTRFSKGLP